MTEPGPGHGIRANPFTTKIGPLPVIAWAVIIVGVGGGIYLLVRKRSHITATTTTAAGNGDPASGADTSGNATTSASPWSANDPANSSGTGSSVSTANGIPSSTDNAQWARNVEMQLVATGSDPTTVSNALADYLGGKRLSAAEHAIINLAITRYGAPPEGVIPIQVDPVPQGNPPPVVHQPVPVHKPTPPPPGPHPPSSRTYVVRGGDNLTEIARRFYGNGDWQKIYAANRAVIGPNPNLIRPGETLVIPA